VTSILWLSFYGFEALGLVWVMSTVSNLEHAAAKGLVVLLLFALLFLLAAAASAVLLLRSALTLRNLDQDPSNEAVEEALRRVGHYWTFCGAFWIVLFLGSVVAALAAGVGAVLL